MKSGLVILVAVALSSSAAFAKGGSGHSSSHSTASTHNSSTHSTHSSDASSSHSSSSSHSVKGYVKKDGTYVAPSHATNPDKDTKNNYSHTGNVNPYTGKVGTKND